MADFVHPWKRFWFLLESVIPLTDRGYLADPDSEYGRALNPDAISTDALPDIHCLALLGEPGIGKSTTLRSHWESVKRAAGERGHQVLDFDLNEFQSDFALIETVFKDPAFLTWKQGEGELHLFLDSLDECRLRIDNVGN